jgi:hypothetical protein
LLDTCRGLSGFKKKYLFEREKDFIKFIYLSKKVGVKFVKLLTVRAMAAATYVQGCGRACGWLAVGAPPHWGGAGGLVGY